MRRSTGLLLALVLVTTGWAGCLGQVRDELDQASKDERSLAGNLTQPVYDMVSRAEHVIQGEVDGQETEEVWLDVYRPSNANHEVPVILVMTPYQALGDATGATSFSIENGTLPPMPPSETPYSPDLVEFYVPRGYAVAFADVRGNHNSGGCIDQSGEGQWRDGYYTVEWLGTRKWSNGNVGMHGASYDGETQVTTALLNPPHLSTIVPVASVDSQYQYLHYGGVPYELQGASTMAAYLAISAVPGTHPNAVQTYPERFTCQPENLEHALDQSGDWNAYWDERAYWKKANQTNVSMLRVHGLQDWNVKPNHIDPLSEKWTGEPKRAIYGQWGHAYPDRPDWSGQGGILHQWYDQFLYEKATGVVDELPPVLAEDTEDRWHGIDAFPARNTSSLSFQLSADGMLTREGAESGELTVDDRPRDAPGASTPNPAEDVAAAAGQPSKLVFESEPLEEELVLTGRPSLTFNASTDAESTHWAVHLEVVEDGEAEWINRGYQDTRHRDGRDQPQPLEPGESYQLDVELFPQVDVVQPGDKLRLVVTTDDEWIHQDDTYATSTVQAGPNATLTLPLLPADASPISEDRLDPRAS